MTDRDELGQSLADDLQLYLSLLGRVRAGDDGAIAELRGVANHICAAWNRCDTKAVAAFYCDLDTEQRVQGLADEATFNEIYDTVATAPREAPSHAGNGGDWARSREELVERLRAFAARVANRADFTPAARAWALLAHLELDSAREAQSLSPAAVVTREAHLERAADDARRSLESFERAGQRTPRLEPLWLLGRVERERGRPAAAARSFSECGELALAVGRDEYRERALQGLIELAKDAGDVARLDRLLAQLASVVSVDESWPLARENALRLLHMDRAEAALEFALRHPPADEDDLPQWHSILAGCFLRTGDLASAAEEVRLLDGGGGELGVLARASYDLTAGDPLAVQIALQNARTDSWSYLGRAQASALLGEALLRDGRPAQAQAHLERALDLASGWRSRQMEEAGGSVVGEWLGLHTVVQLAGAYVDLGRPLEAARVLEAFQSQALRERAAAANGGPATGPTDLTRAHLLAAARAYPGGLLTLGVGADASVVAHVGADGSAVAVRIAPGRLELERAVRRLREAALQGHDERTRALADELFDALFSGPIAERLRAVPAGARVLILLHGPTERLPLALLAIDGVPLDERLTTLVMPGLGGGSDPGTPGTPVRWDETRWVIAGDPRDADGESVLLPGAREEVASLRALHPGAEVLDAERLQRTAFARALREGSALHVATHVVPAELCYAGRLAGEGLLLSGGDVFCADEILLLAPRSPLVVLAACESGGGRFVDAEGLHGVGRAFLEAGTRNVVVSLWPVTDRAALRFSTLFHETLEAGEPPSSALCTARKQMRAEGLDSADWAAFRLIGTD